jgi:hypothetical protein
MFSGTSKSPFVMKRLVPSISQTSPDVLRLVRPAPTSLPASGSVSTIEPPQRFSSRLHEALLLAPRCRAVDHARGEGAE